MSLNQTDLNQTDLAEQVESMPAAIEEWRELRRTGVDCLEAAFRVAMQFPRVCGHDEGWTTFYTTVKAIEAAR